MMCGIGNACPIRQFLQSKHQSELAYPCAYTHPGFYQKETLEGSHAGAAFGDKFGKSATLGWVSVINLCEAFGAMIAGCRQVHGFLLTELQAVAKGPGKPLAW